MAVLDQVLKNILRHAMLPQAAGGDEPRAARVGVAVSGGADSVALLHALLRLGKPRNWSIEVLHVDHGLRGTESDGDRDFVEALAARLGVPCWTERADPRAAGGNLEQAARELRYAFFDRVRTERGLDAVATGHTASDQAETVLMRLLSGASADSLAGIRAVQRGWIVRPLLAVERETVRTWLVDQGETWREDASNQDTCFDRNRIRHELLPLLRQKWNPGVELALSRLASGFSRDESFWTEAVDEAWETCCVRNIFGLVVDLNQLAGRHPAIRLRLLKRACMEAAAAKPRLELTHLEDLMALADKNQGDGRLSLPGLQAWRSFRQLLIHIDRVQRRPADMSLTVPGEIEWAAGGTRIIVRRASNGGAFYNEISNLLDGTKVTGPVVVRAWRDGDAFHARGRQSAQTLHSLFQERLVPAWERGVWPVLEWRGEIVWMRRFGAAMGWQSDPGQSGSMEVVETLIDGRE